VIARALALAVVCAAGCADGWVFRCATDAQCRAGDAQGTCVQPDGVCAFAQASCPSGLAFDRSAGASAGRCVAPADLAPPCCGHRARLTWTGGAAALARAAGTHELTFTVGEPAAGAVAGTAHALAFGLLGAPK
jgi:hypothetical protein